MCIHIQALPWAKESVAWPHAALEPGGQPGGWAAPGRRQWHP